MYSSRRKSKRSYRKRVVSRKNKTRSRRKNLKFRKMRGGGQPPAKKYTTETILSDIEAFKKNNSHFSDFGKGYNQAMEHILKGNRNIDFYKDNLCVFVDFDNDYAANRMYLGKLTSNQDDLTNYGISVDKLSFDCYLLHGHANDAKEFKSTKRFNGGPYSGVLIGFLPSSSKDDVLSKV